jgi:hypothetical protein
MPRIGESLSELVFSGTCGRTFVDVKSPGYHRSARKRNEGENENGLCRPTWLTRSFYKVFFGQDLTLWKFGIRQSTDIFKNG